MGKIKILITVINNTSTDQRMHRIADTLNNNSYEVSFIGHNRPPILESWDKPNNVSLISTLYSQGPLFYLEFNIKLFIKLLFSNFDIVYAVDIDTILAARYASFLKNKKIVFDAHEYYTGTPELNNRKLVKWIWSLVKKISLWHIDLAITVNKKLADLMSIEDGIPYKVIRNFPNYSFKERENEVANNKILIYQGAINKGRFIEEYIEVMDLLPNHHLIIVGSGDLNNKIFNLIEESQSKDRINYMGPVSPSELRTITPQAGIGLNILDKSSTSYYYSLANKFFDYLQAGIPSINMDFPCYQEYLYQYKIGESIKSTEIIELKKMIEYMSHPNKYYTYYAHIKAAAGVLNWENEEQVLLELFKEMSYSIKPARDNKNT